MTTILNSKDMFGNLLKDQEQKHMNPDAYRGYAFPMPWFMTNVGGWGRDWLCYIYGKAGIGKTSVLSTAVTQLGKDNIKFLYLALEESLSVISQRVATNIENINRTKFRDLTLTQVDFTKLSNAIQVASLFPGYWTDDCFTEAEITQAIKDVDPDFILVDYLQLMDMKGQTLNDKVAGASKFLLRVKKGKVGPRPIGVLAAAQLNDLGNCLHSRDPDRDGDVILEVAGIDNGNGGIIPNERLLSIRKNRFGGVGQTRAAFFGGRSFIGQLQTSANRGAIPRP